MRLYYVFPFLFIKFATSRRDTTWKENQTFTGKGKRVFSLVEYASYPHLHSHHGELWGWTWDNEAMMKAKLQDTLYSSQYAFHSLLSSWLDLLLLFYFFWEASSFLPGILPTFLTKILYKVTRREMGKNLVCWMLSGAVILLLAFVK